MSRKRIVVVGYDANLAQYIADAVREQMNTHCSAILTDPSPAELAHKKPDIVVMAPDLAADRRQELHTWAVFHGISCLVVPTLEDLLFTRAHLGRLGDFPILEGRRPALSPDHALMKRMSDIGAALALGVLALPVGLLCAAAVKITDPRSPILYRQIRVGRGGRHFTLYKFRTMVPDAEDATGPVLAQENDPRVTPVGRLLRATRLDELPQLWNVLKGDMSLVGPRPERPEFVREFVQKTPLYALRHNVRPGVTGLAQVLGRYSTDYRDKLRYDLLYVAFASPLLDLKILLLTIRVILVPFQLPNLHRIFTKTSVPMSKAGRDFSFRR